MLSNIVALLARNSSQYWSYKSVAPLESGERQMKVILISAILSLASIVPSAADTIDDEVIKARTSVERAEKKLAAAVECQNNKAQCVADRVEKLTKQKTRIEARLSALTN